jgi:integrase
MSLVAPTLEAFFTERLMAQRHASPHTVASYRYCLKLLVTYVQETTGVAPSKLGFPDLDAKVIGGFLDHLERARGLSVQSRNVRLAAIRSLFTFAALRHPEHAALIGRVLSIPAKRGERALVSFLVPDEVDALLASPDRSRRTGRRDHALLVLALQTGLRVTELSALRIDDLHLGTGATLRREGQERAHHSPHQDDRRGDEELAHRARRRGRRSRLPRAERRPARARRDPAARRTPRYDGRQSLPVARREKAHAAHAPAHLRHAAPRERDGHRHDRFVAGSCDFAYDRGVSPRAPRLERARDRADRAARHRARPLSAA